MAYQAVQYGKIQPNKVKNRIVMQGIDSEVQFNKIDFDTVQVNIEKWGIVYNITVYYRTVG